MSSARTVAFAVVVFASTTADDLVVLLLDESLLLLVFVFGVHQLGLHILPVLRLIFLLLLH